MHSTFFDALAEASLRAVSTFSPQDLSSISWSFAVVAVLNRPLLQVIGEEACKADESSPQDLANTAWAFASLRIFYEPLVAAIAMASKQTLDQFSCQNLANTAWAFAKVV